MAYWVALRPIFGVRAKESGYEGRGKIQLPWWRQAAAEKWPSVTLEYILAAARERWRQESGRCGRSKVREEGGLLIATGEGESKEYCYAGTKTCGDRVGG